MIAREPGVIEGRPGPIDERVAGVARLGESNGRMVRIRSAVVLGSVARIAIRRRAGKFAAHVALRASRGGVLAAQRETGG